MDGLGDHTMSEDERLGIFSMYYDIDADHEGSNAVTTPSLRPAPPPR